MQVVDVSNNSIAAPSSSFLVEPPRSLATMPPDELDLIVKQLPFDFTSLNGLEAASTALQDAVRRTWAERLKATFTSEARSACQATLASAKLACRSMLRCPFIFWGDTYLPAEAQAAIDALAAVGGVIECPACWPVAIKPLQLAQWWSVQALAKAFLMLSELQFGTRSSSSNSGSGGGLLEPPWSVPVYAQNAATDLSLLALCDALREGRRPCEPGEVIRRTDGLLHGYSSDGRTVGPNVRPGNFLDGAVEPSAVAFRTHIDPEDHPGARYHPFDDAESRQLALAVVNDALFGGKASIVLDFLERSEDGEEDFDHGSLPWAGTDTVYAACPDGGYGANHGWGGVNWDAGREWWGCYCWVALRTLADGEFASEFTQMQAGGSQHEEREETLVMLQLAAASTD
jgi:hypothetical protein